MLVQLAVWLNEIENQWLRVAPPKSGSTLFPNFLNFDGKFLGRRLYLG